jgi:predicted esterase
LRPRWPRCPSGKKPSCGRSTWRAGRWPTRKDKVAGSKFSTEDFILAAIKAVGEKHKLDPRRVFTFSWSSGGWAAWHASFLKEIRGSFIAMAVFYPEQLPPLAQAKGRVYYLYHSPEDDVCKFQMAQAARDALTRNGALVRLTTYAGGHGWHGDIFGDIRRGLEWLVNPLPPAAQPGKRAAQP